MSLPAIPLDSLDLELPATAASVPTARHAVAEFSAGQTLDHAAIAIAVSEAVTNAVMHAYRDREPGAAASWPASATARPSSSSATTDSACTPAPTAAGWASDSS